MYLYNNGVQWCFKAGHNGSCMHCTLVLNLRLVMVPGQSALSFFNRHPKHGSRSRVCNWDPTCNSCLKAFSCQSAKRRFQALGLVMVCFQFSAIFMQLLEYGFWTLSCLCITICIFLDSRSGGIFEYFEIYLHDKCLLHLANSYLELFDLAEQEANIFSIWWTKSKLRLIKLHTKIIYNKSNLEINKARFMWVGMRHDIQKCFPFFSISANDLVMRQRRQTVCQVWNCCYLSQCQRTSAHRLESNTLLSIDCETKGNKTGMKYQKKTEASRKFQNRKPMGEVHCCEWWMAVRTH